MKKLVKNYILIVSLIALAFVSYTISRYVVSKTTDIEYPADEFYFTSNILDTSDVDKEYNLGTGVDNLQIELYNFADELRITQTVINYKVEVYGDTVLTHESSGVIQGGSKGISELNLENLTGEEVKVVVTSTFPYKHELTATFYRTNIDNTIYYEVIDNGGNEVYLKIKTVDYIGNIGITWVEDLIVDNTSNQMGDVIIDSAIVYMSNNSEYTWVFFKKDPSKSFNKDSFEIKTM